MKVLWTPRAAADLDEAVAFISRDTPNAAAGVAQRIYTEILTLESTPAIGRPGKLPGTYELIFHPWQYMAVYKVTAEAVRILRIRHTSRR